MNISYTKKGDYLLPNLILKDKEQYNIGKYGLLRLEYIKKHKLELYFDLLMNDTLNEYLHDIDTIVMEKVQMLINELAEKENINEEIKQKNELPRGRALKRPQDVFLSTRARYLGCKP